MPNNRYDPGSWKVICDVCGRTYKASDLQRRWDGVLVCADDYEARHPQDFVRGVADTQAPPYTRPEPDDTFIYTTCTVYTSQGLSDYGAADCARADTDYGAVPTCTLANSQGVATIGVAGCAVAGKNLNDY